MANPSKTGYSFLIAAVLSLIGGCTPAAKEEQIVTAAEGCLARSSDAGPFETCMAKAGFDPRESVELWKNMNSKNEAKIPEYMSTHPSGETRIESLIEQYPTALSYYNEAKLAGREPNCTR